MLPTTIASLACCALLIPTLGTVGAAWATTVATVASQALYIWDQHRHLLVAASRVWTLWATGLALGIAQALVGTGAIPRLLWAAAGSVLLAAMVRRGACVNATLVRELLGSRLHPLATLINRVFVATA
jgi:O-antigen/teichoic acid export membrane protein